MQYHGVGRHHDQWPQMRLHVVANGTMTGQRYIDEVLLPHVSSFPWCHSEGIQRLVWPARSPDLNHIENVWDALRRQVAGQKLSSDKQEHTLIRALTEEWDKLPQQLLDNVVQNNEVHFWLNGYVNKQNCRILSEANPQVYVETPLHPEKLTVWCALWAGGILLQKR
ncbi:hypothetical protein TNCV_4289501 [Trichonephila clavipes]|nr:hypothetical protein TNCV_4289501 [Trichonephila clavipes]